ncbi:capsular polysaccharide synthesis protein [Weissella cibaria]|uniref:capsular polysaccharide synthesis protein n=1 Tax=Weissella cibaria TaxID=137591 RepID=UPI0005BC1CDC|nr:capsular polysaccharide synthesis protein [Weissella cibaria]MDV8930779.1 capsular polysaccharide synthesis protein [Weissella cibaria]
MPKKPVHNLDISAAFVSDYIRLYLLDRYGGVYLDADMYMVENLDYIAKDDQLVFCREHGEIPFCCGFIAALPGQEFIHEALEQYNEKTFSLNKLKANTQELSSLILKFYPFLKTGESNYVDGIHQFGRLEMLHPSKSSKLIHVGMASWGGENPVRQKISILMRRRLTNKTRVLLIMGIYSIVRKIWINPFSEYESVKRENENW